MCMPSLRPHVDDRKLQNLLRESLVLFESVVNSRWFSRTSIILFLTGVDEFKAKLPQVSCSFHSFFPRYLGFYSSRQVPLSRYFPEYTGGVDVNKAVKYILWRFMQANHARLSVCTPNSFLLPSVVVSNLPATTAL